MRHLIRLEDAGEAAQVPAPLDEEERSRLCRAFHYTWEDVQNNPTDFIAGGGSSETEIEFNSAGVTAIKTVPLTDRAVNQVTLGSGVESAVFRFPAKTQGRARDFMLRLVITGSTVPEIGFVESDGTTEVAFDADDDSWADIEQGVNILMFTDTQEASA